MSFFNSSESTIDKIIYFLNRILGAYNFAIKSIGAGMFISIGCCIFLNLYKTNFLLGCFMFSFGLLSILLFQLPLYTGLCGLLEEENKHTCIVLLTLLFSLIFNIFGTTFIAFLTYISPDVFSTIITNNQELLISKLSKYDTSMSPWNILFSGWFCGAMMYTAVTGYKKYNTAEYGITKNILVIWSVFIFLALGWEHSVANSYYVALGMLTDKISISDGCYLILLPALGNLLGAQIFYFHTRFQFISNQLLK